MGTFTYPLTIYSADNRRHATAQAMVDTGSLYTWLPRDLLKSLGYSSTFKRQMRTADGRIVEREAAEVKVGLNGESHATIVIFAEATDMVLLGAVTLEEFALAPDPIHKRLLRIVGTA